MLGTAIHCYMNRLGHHGTSSGRACGPTGVSTAIDRHDQPRYPRKQQLVVRAASSDDWPVPSSRFSAPQSLQFSRQPFTSGQQAASTAPSRPSPSSLSIALEQVSPKKRLEVADDGSGGTVTVKFFLQYQTSWGQSIKVIGSHAKLGNWQLQGAPELMWQQGGGWGAAVVLPASVGVLEYKYVVIDYHSKSAVAWQQGGNGVLAVKPGEPAIEVHDNWGNDPGAMIKTADGSSTRELKLQEWAGEMMSYRSEARVVRMDASQHKAEAAELRAEVMRLRSQLQQAQAANMASGLRIAELQQDNMRVTAQLTSMQAEMCETLKLAINMMQGGGDEDDAFDEGAEDGEAAMAGEDEEDGDDKGDGGNDEGGLSSQWQQPTNGSGSSSTSRTDPVAGIRGLFGLRADAVASSAAAPLLSSQETSRLEEGSHRSISSDGNGRRSAPAGITKAQQQAQQQQQQKQPAAPPLAWGSSLTGTAA